MAVYAIGDLQGCYTPLRQLLDRIGFDPGADRLWFAGDLVNRGPESLECLRFVRSLGERAVTVLGNHDMHLLAVAFRPELHPKPKDTLAQILDAPDAGELLHWLRQQPFFHHDPELGHAMVHAGLPPQWDLAEAVAREKELSAAVGGPDYAEFFRFMYGNQPDRWDPELEGMDRLRFILNCFTRMRFVTAEGQLDFDAKGPPGSQPEGLMPWYSAPGRASRETPIVFGHWSTVGRVAGHNVHALDTGCVWGGQLTALRLDPDEAREYCVDCPTARRPG